ncbi:hypothetical protein MLD38_033216 [Melastoma candidum]|uniref:Uncharacterized protein n=1 Tax=Melastoma candidum TaxID=119954 RepID=A0ACB9M6L7_9MYRT|nr:hypothetical protein MLD38_033216 [Melastoma candidum]
MRHDRRIFQHGHGVGEDREGILGTGVPDVKHPGDGAGSPPLSVPIPLCDLGINPEALAAVVRELWRERSALASNQDQKQLKQWVNSH